MLRRLLKARRHAAAWLSCIAFIQAGDMEARDRDPFATVRYRMVQQQIQRRGIVDPRLLEAMRRVPRHLFVPEDMAPYAYEDEPLPIGHGQTISQPYIVAYMTEALKLKGDEKVLEIGTGSGYQAAILAELAASVYTIEIVEPLAARAKTVLDRLKYDNVHFLCGDGYAGWPSEAPFDAVMVTAAPADVPVPLFDQLNEGGRLILPVGETWQELVLITKHSGKMEKQPLIPVRFVPMTGEAGRIK